MRKTLIAMLGLVALGLWAMPALAEPSNKGPLKDPPKVSEPVPLENRAGIWQTRLGGSRYQGTLSGTLIQDATPTTTWFMYPGSCGDRINGVPGTMGTWAPRSTPQADSLDSYTNGTTGPYDILDQSLSEILWNISDSAPADKEPAQFATGSTRQIWCGKYDANWVVKVGYPNLTYQILYIDTGAHTIPGTYTFAFEHLISAELKYDFVYLIGGGGNGAVDPIGNSRAQLDIVIADGHGPDDPNPNNIQYLLVSWTGSITSGESFVTGTLPHNRLGSASGAPAPGSSSYTIGGQHRALYLVFKADCLFSSEDGLWPEGNGQLIDNLQINGAPFWTNEAQVVNSGGFPVTDSHQGIVLKGVVTDDLNKLGDPTNGISARVAPGVGENWHLVDGLGLPTPDVCTPKRGSTDLIFVAGLSGSHATIKNEFESVVNCSFYVPTGTASVLALWDQYLDLPRFQGFVQYSEYRIYDEGSWGGWDNTHAGGGVHTGAAQAWALHGDDLAKATQADSFQVRYNMQCIPFFSADHNNCGAVTYGILYDNFRVEIVTGTPQPIFGVFVGAVAQSMFVDGAIPGSVGCSAGQISTRTCWPGVRGSNIGTAAAIHDNFNSPLGDSITLSLTTGLRKNGKGINWHLGFDKSVNAGMTIAHTNPNYHPGAHPQNGSLICDAPRIIFRIFDPTSKSWSPFDSSELDANAVAVSAGDTVLIDSEYRVNWPPRDKAASPLPGGFTVTPIGGSALGNYSQLAFMPKGSRIQYYWKAVDLNCGTSYQFSSDNLAREVEDLPTLPGSSIIAPDIIEFDVLPRVYAAGAAGTLLDGKTDTPILDLDGSYTRWNFGSHATVQVLRSLGVRADRYRTLQGLEEGGHIGGHEFAGTRQGRLSNYFPNMDEYFIKDLLAAQYRIMIESSHTSTTVVDEESDSKLIKDWWSESTGNNGGDRCIFASGDDFFNALLQVGGVAHPNENALASQVFGVATVSNAWNGNLANQQPLIRDMFADPAAGGAAWPSGLGTPGVYTYLVDGGCPAPNRFDALTPIGGGTAQVAALYPLFAGVSNGAAVSNLVELDDPSGDFDRSKALGYGYSIQFIRQGGMNNVDARAQVLYKFLTSCRGPRTSETGICWPCPSNASPIPANWATATVFQTGTYGPLYPIQDATRFLTGVDSPAGAPAVNRLQGNFPNPFNPETAIRFSSARAGRAEVRIFDVAGRLVQTLSKNVTQGVNEVRWNGKSSNGTNLASGVYFVKVKNADGSESQNSLKIAIVR